MSKVLEIIKRGIGSLTSIKPDIEDSTIEKEVEKGKVENPDNIRKQLEEAQRQAEKIMQGGFVQSRQNPTKRIEKTLEREQHREGKEPTNKDSEIERE